LTSLQFLSSFVRALSIFYQSAFADFASFQIIFDSRSCKHFPSLQFTSTLLYFFSLSFIIFPSLSVH
jgi:hypothetical protein